MGFTSVVHGELLSTALQRVPGVERLYVLPSGPIPPNPSELLATERCHEVLASLQADDTLVILDTPPVLDSHRRRCARAVGGRHPHRRRRTGRHAGSRCARRSTCLRQMSAPDPRPRALQRRQRRDRRLRQGRRSAGAQAGAATSARSSRSRRAPASADAAGALSGSATPRSTAAMPAPHWWSECSRSTRARSAVPRSASSSCRASATAVMHDGERARRRRWRTRAGAVRRRGAVSARAGREHGAATRHRLRARCDRSGPPPASITACTRLEDVGQPERTVGVEQLHRPREHEVGDERLGNRRARIATRRGASRRSAAERRPLVHAPRPAPAAGRRARPDRTVRPSSSIRSGGRGGSGSAGSAWVSMPAPIARKRPTPVSSTGARTASTKSTVSRWISSAGGPSHHQSTGTAWLPGDTCPRAGRCGCRRR